MIVGLYKGLHIFWEGEIADRWMTMPNTGAPFEGATPFAYMLDGRTKAFTATRAYNDNLSPVLSADGVPYSPKANVTAICDDHVGSSFDRFLDGEGIRDEVDAAAKQRAADWQAARPKEDGVDDGEADNA